MKRGRGDLWLKVAAAGGGLVIILPLLVRVFLFQPFRIPQGSMIPTLRPGDHMFIAKLGYTPRRGDVVVFRYPKDRDMDFVKRVVAVGGDTIAVAADGSLLLNGGAVPRRAVEGPCRYDDRDEESGAWRKRECVEYIEKLDTEYRIFQDPDRAPQEFPEVKVPAGHVFAMGDNRDNSYDSRYWGFVPVGDVKGRMLGVWMRGNGPP